MMSMTSFTRPHIPSSNELEAVLITAVAVAVAAGDGSEAEQTAFAHTIANRAQWRSGGCDGSRRLDPQNCRDAAIGLLSDVLAGGAARVPTEATAPVFWRALGLVCHAIIGEDGDPTDGATRCHRHDAAPHWAEGLAPVALVGRLFFYDVAIREP